MTMEKEQHEACIKGCDRFYFSDWIVFRPCDDGWLVISVNSANWMLLQNETQKEMLQQLMSGKSIEEVCGMMSDESQWEDLQYLLTCIMARKFASVNEPLIMTGEEDALNRMYAYLTNGCNLYCPQCFMSSGHVLKNELNGNDWVRILRDFQQAGGTCVTFSGGEPLLHPDFPQIVKTAHQIGLSVTVLSNGALWNDSLISSCHPCWTRCRLV
jgi:uncharacterized radical SAM superfamily Fe-S cluster-containing enzyme